MDLYTPKRERDRGIAHTQYINCTVYIGNKKKGPKRGTKKPEMMIVLCEVAHKDDDGRLRLLKENV